VSDKKRNKLLALATGMLIMFLCVAKESYGWGKFPKKE
jgi:hypothetical protein